MSVSKNEISVIILAAGIGRRMNSDIPKVLQKVGGKPIIVKTLETLEKINPAQTIIVASPRNINLLKKEAGAKYSYAIQKFPLGTADAAAAGLSKVNPGSKSVAVIYGDDSAFYKPQTLTSVITQHQKTKAVITFITLYLDNPSGLGRIVRRNGKVIEIVEEKDASPDQRKIREVNDGFYIFDKKWLSTNLVKIKQSIATGELYLTDLIELALSQNLNVGTYTLKDSNQWHGVNTPQELEIANLKANIFNENLHFMGIGGAGESAVAALSLRYGFNVNGCDINPNSAYTKNLNIKIAKGHNISHLKGITKLVISPAVSLLNPYNPELLHARKNKIPILTWQKFQGEYLQRNKFVIAIAGGYGKSTTTAMTSKILDDMGFDPTCVVGAKLIDWGTNFRLGRSKYFVCEADEYNNNFLNYKPDIAVILNVTWDHPDFFKTKSDLLESYMKFIGNIKKNGTLVIGPDKDLEKIVASIRLDINKVTVKDFGKTHLSIIGDFRKENSDAALSLARLLQINPAKAKRSVEQFGGLERRLEYKGKVANCRIYDDYAVQPYTILKTANALRDKFPKSRIVLVFEPHTYSRIVTFFNHFISSLKNVNVDEILITDVFGAREKGDDSKLSIKLAKALTGKCRYTGSLENTAKYIKKNLSNYDIVLSMGAGNVYKTYNLLKSL